MSDLSQEGSGSNDPATMLLREFREYRYKIGVFIHCLGAGFVICGALLGVVSSIFKMTNYPAIAFFLVGVSILSAATISNMNWPAPKKRPRKTEMKEARTEN